MLCHAVNHGDNSTEMFEPMMKDEKKCKIKLDCYKIQLLANIIFTRSFCDNAHITVVKHPWLPMSTLGTLFLHSHNKLTITLKIKAQCGFSM